MLLTLKPDPGLKAKNANSTSPDPQHLVCQTFHILELGKAFDVFSLCISISFYLSLFLSFSMSNNPFYGDFVLVLVKTTRLISTVRVE